MRNAFFSGLLALALVPLAAQAQVADITRNGLFVIKTGPNSFAIPYRGRSGARDFWCAAGDYVRYELHMPGVTRIYRTSPLPRRAGKGVSFSLSPTGAQSTGLAVIGSPRGISASHALLQCDAR